MNREVGTSSVFDIPFVRIGIATVYKLHTIPFKNEAHGSIKGVKVAITAMICRLMVV